MGKGVGVNMGTGGCVSECQWEVGNSLWVRPVGGGGGLGGVCRFISASEPTVVCRLFLAVRLSRLGGTRRHTCPGLLHDYAPVGHSPDIGYCCQCAVCKSLLNPGGASCRIHGWLCLVTPLAR